jgi:hypothetical protein
MTNSNINVSVSNYQRNGGAPTGTLTFSFSGPHVGGDGTIDLRQVQDSVDLQFNLAISPGSGGPPNVRWAAPDEAIWIKHGAGCPSHQGHEPGQFGNPQTPGQNILKITDANATPKGESPNYAYLLRVVVDDNGTPVTCTHDPMIINRIDEFR